MKGILPPLWLATQFHVNQWKWVVVSGTHASGQTLHCDLQAIQEEGSLMNGHIRPTDLPLQCGEAHWTPSYPGCGNGIPQTCWYL